ncbi:hypothetical protein [Stenotrophomonas bentonitica]
MSFTVTDLRAIAGYGGGMILSARGFTTTDLRSIAASANSGGGLERRLSFAMITLPYQDRSASLFPDRGDR